MIVITVPLLFFIEELKDPNDMRKSHVPIVSQSSITTFKNILV